MADAPGSIRAKGRLLGETQAQGYGVTSWAIAEEVPVALVYNGTSHVVMMATPLDLEDFGLGFSLSEGILEKADELLDIEVARGDSGGGIEIRMNVTARQFARLGERRRNLAGRTGCGLCGVDSIAAALRTLAPVRSELRLPVERIHAAFSRLAAAQPLNRATHSVHAAAFADKEGAILAAREDVGRHNALDKLIGALARGGFDFGAGFAVITSRCSMEMVQKAAAVGIPLLVSVSAPTALALELAERYRIAIVAMAGPGNAIAFTSPWRIATEGAKTAART